MHTILVAEQLRLEHERMNAEVKFVLSLDWERRAAYLKDGDVRSKAAGDKLRAAVLAAQALEAAAKCRESVPPYAGKMTDELQQEAASIIHRVALDKYEAAIRSLIPADIAAEMRRLAADSERYRWLRLNIGQFWDEIWTVHLEELGPSSEEDEAVAKRFDAALDAARKQAT